VDKRTSPAELSLVTVLDEVRAKKGYLYCLALKETSSPNAFVGDPETSCIKAATLGPRLRGDDEWMDALIKSTSA